MAYTFTAELWEWSGKAAWHFVTLPPALSDEIAEATADTRRGFGAVAVTVTVGASRWETSIFPSKTEAAYILPVKQEVRAAEGLAPGGSVGVSLELRALSA